MEAETILILLFVVATAVAIAVQRLAVPYTVALVVTGLGLGLLHAFQAPHLTKALLFNVFLPGLLFEAAVGDRQFFLLTLEFLGLGLGDFQQFLGPHAGGDGVEDDPNALDKLV